MPGKVMLIRLTTTVLFLFFSMGNIASAQDLNNAGDYLDYITAEFTKISKDTWSYTSAASHGKKAKKVDNLRKELISTVYEAKKKIERMPDFKKDGSLRDSLVSYLNLNYNVLKQDYAKIMDLEDIAEQSYDLMEAYLLAQEIADKKLENAGDMIEAQQIIFADKNNITLVYSEDKISKKLKEANLVYEYYRPAYLIFFKSYKEEVYLLDALNKNDLVGIEQNRVTLLKYTKEGISKLDSMAAFKGDASLKNACIQILKFYQNEAETKIPILTDFFLKKENFEKLKAAIEAKPPANRTNQEITEYNKAVNDYNNAVKTFNSTNQDLNKDRSKQLDNWNKTVSNFLDKQVPKNK
jgi:hypothetical protein